MRKSGYIYFMASPDDATQQYLYRIKLDGTGEKQLLSPGTQPGTHDYDVSPNGAFAEHKFSNANFEGFKEWVSLPEHKPLDGNANKYDAASVTQNVKFFKVTTEDNITLDGFMVKPTNFDSTKKYPVVFYVYTEPAGQTVTDSYGAADDFLYAGDMPGDGYIYISLDGRGTPAPKGAAWRKAIYRKIGMVNIRDQAMAAKKIIATALYGYKPCGYLGLEWRSVYYIKFVVSIS